MKKRRRRWEGGSKKGGGGSGKQGEKESFIRLTPSPCSLFLHLLAALFKQHTFLETFATQARMKTANFMKALND